MLQQHRIVPEALKIKALEQEPVVRKNDYERSPEQSRGNFESAMAANEKRQQLQYQRQQDLQQQQRYQERRQQQERVAEQAQTKRNEAASRVNDTSQPPSRDDVNERRVEHQNHNKVNEHTNERRDIREPFSKAIQKTELASSKDTGKAEQVLTELATKFGSKEGATKLQQLISKMEVDGLDADIANQLKALVAQLQQLMANQSSNVSDDSTPVLQERTLAQLEHLLVGLTEALQQVNLSTEQGSELPGLEELKESLESVVDSLTALLDSKVHNEQIVEPTVEPEVSFNDEVAPVSDEEQQHLDWITQLLSQANITVSKSVDIPVDADVDKQNANPSISMQGDTLDKTKSLGNLTEAMLQQSVKLSDENSKELQQSEVVTGQKSKSETAILTSSLLAALQSKGLNVKDASTQANQSGVNALAFNMADGAELETNQQLSPKVFSELTQLNQLGNDKGISLAAMSGLEPSVTKTPSAKTDFVEVLGVQLDKTLQAPKLESVAQAKSELMIKENILFNKQELASNIQQQVGLMMARNLKSVDIRLDPPELGSMQIKLHLGGEQANVSFVVSSQQAKDALEGSIPKLRELLEQQGMQLADSDVRKDNSNQNGQEEAEQASSQGRNGSENTDVASEQSEENVSYSVKSPWQVDYYA